MERIYAFFQARPRLMVGAGVGIILIVILSLVMSSKNSSSTQNLNTLQPTQSFSDTPTVSPANSDNNNSSIVTITPTPGVETHIAGGYQMVYPASWNEQNNSVVGGGSSFILMPTDKPEDEYFPRITFEVTPLRPPDAITAKEAQLQKIYNLAQSNVRFHDISATKLDGILNFHWDSGNPSQKPVHKTILIFNQGNYTYVVEYAYFDDGSASAYLDLLNQMLDSFQFKT